MIMTDVTRILNAIEQGYFRATDELIPLVYDELRLLAAQKLTREPPGQTIQATALVHDVYIRLVEEKAQNWNSRGHYFRAAAEAMRRILVENARSKKRLKWGGDLQRIELKEVEFGSEQQSDDLLAVNEALEKLVLEKPSLAEQTTLIHRKVALKIIKLGMDTKSIIARFEAEH